MKDLVNRTNHSLDTKINHPLLSIANFIVRFLAIHPFQDGNGRLSRALTTLLLIQNGYLYVPYCSLERIIEDNKEEYYRTLRRAQTTLNSPESLIGDWISFFINCLLIQKNILVKKIDQERLTASLPPLSEKLMDILKSRGILTGWEDPGLISRLIFQIGKIADTFPEFTRLLFLFFCLYGAVMSN